MKVYIVRIHQPVRIKVRNTAAQLAEITSVHRNQYTQYQTV